MFESALEHPSWKEWRADIAPKCFRYREGDQWTAAERATLRKRKQPEITNNQVSVTINRLIGQFVKQKYRIKYQGRNEPDKLGAAALSDIMLFIRQTNGLEFEERDQVDDGFTSGFGVLEVGTVWDDNFEAEIKITAEDGLDVFPDPHSRRYDWNEDAKFVCRVKLPTLDEATELYPKKKAELEALVNDSPDSTTEGETSEADALRYRNYVDEKNKRLLLIEIEWKTYEKVNKVLVATPKGPEVFDADDLTKADFAKFKKTGQAFKQVDRVETKLHSAVFTKGIILETKDLKRKRFKWVPLFMYRRKSGSPYSLVWLGLQMQDMINKYHSKSTHLLNSTRTITSKGNIEDKKEWATQIASPDGIAEAKDIEKVKVQEHTDLGQVFYNMHISGMKDFRSIVGVNPDALGEPSEIRSGVGVKAKVAMTDLVVAPVFDNCRRTRVCLGKTILEFVQLYYTEGKIFSITDDLKKTRSVSLKAAEMSSIKQGIYDVVEEDAADITTIRAEQHALLLQYMPQIVPLGPFWQKVALRTSDIVEKDDLIAELEKMSKPPPDMPKISFTSKLEEMHGPERAAAWEMMGRPDVGQAIAGVQPASVQEGINDQGTEQLKQRGAQAKAQADQTKAQADMAKVNLDMTAKQLEVAGKKELMALELQKKKIEVAIAAINAKAAAQRPKGDKNGKQQADSR